MAEQTIHCSQACTVTVQHEFVVPLLNLDSAAAAQIAVAIIGVWAIGFGIRAIIQHVRLNAKPEE